MRNMSMRSRQGGKNRLPHILVFVLAIIVTILILVVVPLPYQWKKFLFFALIILFSIIGVIGPCIIRRK